MVRRTPFLIALFLALGGSGGFADVVPADQIAGKTGAFQIKLTERSPLSAPSEIAKRTRAKPADLGDDYDLSQETFDVYVPAAPDENGSYGLMVGVVFANNHGFAPEAWRPVLDQHHMIWIANGGADDGTPAQRRMGVAVDAVHNAPKLWPIDPDRIYLSMNTWKRPTTGLWFYYPEVFHGTLAATFSLSWFDKIKDPKNRVIWQTDNLTRPSDLNWDLAKTHSRILFVLREADPSEKQDDLVFSHGWQNAGFKYLKLVRVPHEDMDLWSHYTGGWFDDGITYLDERPVESSPPPVTSAPSVPMRAQPVAAPPTTKPAAPSDDPNAKAAQALSLATNYISAARYDLARSKLQKLIETYPTTPAAKEAKSLLAEIQGK